MTKKPPSRIRYERSHPMVSARLDEETYNKLQEMVKSEGKSLAGFLKDFVRNEKRKWDGAYQRGCDHGAKSCRVWYYCSVCGERIDMEPRGESHKKMIKYMKDHGWGHSGCHEKMNL